ncbi:MAG: hypothetical protein RL318_2127 [Fibrobacterota bacterium]|jgi:endo-1,4-beta-D-glucanase Y
MNFHRLLSAAILFSGLTGTAWSAAKYPFPRGLTYKYGTKAGGTTAQGAAIVTATGSEIQTAFNNWKSSQLDSSGNTMRVKFDDPNYTVSEGIGYGMLIMVYMDNATNNTQGQFDKLWAYYNKYLNGNKVMHWKIQGFSGVNQQNGATDAELDVALALLMAYKQWGNASYLTDAKNLISVIWSKEVANNRLKPGDAWDDYKNPSYFSPGALELFKLVDANGWSSVMTNEYAMIKANQNTTTGITSDWCQTSGSAVSGKESKQLGMNYDGVRTPWRLAIGYAWYGHAEAKAINDKLAAWLTSTSSPVAGSPAKVMDGYTQSGTATGKFNVVTFVGAFGAAGMSNTANQTWLNNSYYRTRVGADGTGYYHASLKVLYQLLMSGNFNNFWDDASMVSGVSSRQTLPEVKVSRQGMALQIEAGSLSDLRVNLVDLKGSTLRTGTADNARLSLDLSGLSQGAYALQLKSSKGSEVRTFALTGN